MASDAHVADVPVSVVTPFYNTADYLAECIESVLAQTHRRFEYLLVDNQSTDGSADIARRYAARDDRIRVIRNTEFVAQVPNYNNALLHIAADSRYCKLVQADDALFPRCLEEMLALAVAHPSVGIVSSYRMHGAAVAGSGLPHDRTVLSGRDACRLALMDDVYLFGSPTTLLFRADIVRARRPFWELDRLHEDTEAVFEILRDQDFGFVHQVLSFSRLDPRSIMGKWADFGPYFLDLLILYRRYGRDYLSDDEYQRHVAAHEARYHRFLLKAWLARRGKEFWDYQDKGLATIGERLDRMAIARAAVPALLNAALPPALADGLRWLKRRVLAPSRS